MPARKHNPLENELLAALPGAEWKRVRPSLELVAMPLGHVLYESGSHRLKGQELKQEFTRATSLQNLLLRYTQALPTQMAQTAVCNRHHSVDQQLCRWLLLSLDRLDGNELTMTQELIANMLGVRREGVTQAAGKLQKLKVIRYVRGKITVLDRPMLEGLCCECYAVVKRETDRLRAVPRSTTT